MKLKAIEPGALGLFVLSVKVTAPARGCMLRPSLHRMLGGVCIR